MINNIKTPLSPFLYENQNTFGIIGSEKGLLALAEIIISKVRLGKGKSLIYNDDVNRPIEIILDEDIL